MLGLNELKLSEKYVPMVTVLARKTNKPFFVPQCDMNVLAINQFYIDQCPSNICYFDFDNFVQTNLKAIQET